MDDPFFMNFCLLGCTRGIFHSREPCLELSIRLYFAKNSVRLGVSHTPLMCSGGPNGFRASESSTPIRWGVGRIICRFHPERRTGGRLNFYAEEKKG